MKKKFISFETTSKKKNGIEIPINIDITVIKNENKDILYQIINIKNIAENKKIQEELEFKKFAMNQMDKGVFLINKNGNFTYANQFACNLLGYSKNELLQLNIEEINYKFKKWNKYWEIIKRNKTISIEQPHKMKNGITIPIEMVITYFYYKESEYNLFFVRDISDKYKMKNEIKLLKNEIKTLRENYYI